MALVTNKPEDLPSGNDLDNIEDPDEEQQTDERAEIYLSGSHVCTLDNAPRNRERITMMVDLEVFEETTRANGDEDVPIRKAKRIGDMYLPGTTRPPSKEELAAEAKRAKLQAAREQAERDEAERAEAEHNEPPMFDEDGNPVSIDAPRPQDGNDVVEVEPQDGPWPGDVDHQADNSVPFSDGAE